jgi:hypothetical protein
MSGRKMLAGSLTAAALTLAGLGAMVSTAGATVPPRPDQILSNENTVTRWAYVAHLTPVYRQPSTSSRQITWLHVYTENFYPEVYLLLRAHWDKRGREWIELRIPTRPNGLVGWVSRRALYAFHMTHDRIVVNRERLRIYFYTDGQQVWSAPVAVGKQSTPTPRGHFWIREVFPRLPAASGYAPYAFGTSDYSTLADWEDGGVVGIHGPYFQAQQIPGRISHGCIRLRVADDNWLGQHLRVGTPLLVI